MQIDFREYKLLVNHGPFADPLEAVKAIWAEIEEAVRPLPLVRTEGKPDEIESRTISFFDTPDHALRRNGLVLRRRTANAALEYTLKCRSEDRYIAAGTDVSPADGLKAKPKLEEDIAPPFFCRLSNSATILINGKRKSPSVTTLATLGKATALFPLLRTLHTEGQPYAPETPLAVVNNITVDETVWKGSSLIFEQERGGKPETATLALILWTRGQPAIAELSFRIKESEDRFSRSLAQTARSLYTQFQRLDCARRDGMTKTEYIYRDATRD